jgi:uncharacterized protein YeaO (DUF488 family)
MAARRRRTSHDPTTKESASGAFSSPACYAHEFETPPRRRSGHAFDIRRVYDPPAATDGYRVLIDRLWPRGVSKQRAALAAWLPELAPSTALRQWFHRDPQRWREFAARYRSELRAQVPLLQSLRQRACGERVTLLYGARDPHRNHAIVLREILRRARTASSSRPSRR